MANKVAYLGLAKRDKATDDFVFDFELKRRGVTHLAPNVFSRDYSATYSPVPIAQSDHTPREFRATNAADISIEFMIVGDGQLDVEASLSKLRRFMRKDKRTGQPPNLILVMGKKSWLVQIDKMKHTPKLWNSEINEQQVHVSIQFHTVEWEK